MGSIALFGTDNDVKAALACTAGDRRITLLLDGDPAGSTLQVRTTSVSRTLSARTLTTREGERLGLSAARPLLAASLPASDSLLDAIIYSRGKVNVQGGGADLILPAWPEVGRVVEDCRG